MRVGPPGGSRKQVEVELLEERAGQLGTHPGEQAVAVASLNKILGLCSLTKPHPQGEHSKNLGGLNFPSVLLSLDLVVGLVFFELSMSGGLPPQL